MDFSSLDLVRKIIKCADDKKAFDISVLNISDVTVISDYFVICSGNSVTQIKAIADEIDHKLRLAGLEPIHFEGYREGNWIVIDYACVMVHIFHKDTRDFYQLERLWADGKPLGISELLNLDSQGDTL